MGTTGCLVKTFRFGTRCAATVAQPLLDVEEMTGVADTRDRGDEGCCQLGVGHWRPSVRSTSSRLARRFRKPQHLELTAQKIQLPLESTDPHALLLQQVANNPGSPARLLRRITWIGNRSHESLQ
jgi:hypothetical protein